ncbi:MAG: ABC transporter permease [Oscillospiraceae bacterium]|jgi:ABC-2 type transport system permease protein|nr:ABC transporter permease [Oscillospiraceae bacterium]
MKVYGSILARLARGKLNWLFVIFFPALIGFVMILTGGVNEAMESGIKAGLADLDGTVLSQALVKQLETRYTCSMVPEGETSVLTERTVDYLLTIPAGYQASLMAGQVPELRGASLKLSDAQFMAGSTAETVTRALLLLAAGAEEAELPALIEEWVSASRVTVSAVAVAVEWDDLANWLGFYGWIGMLTAFFLVKTVMLDRFKGLPERVGVLPVSRRRYLLQCILAVFSVSELSVAVLLAGTWAAWGAAPPNLPYLALLLSCYNLFSVGLLVGLYSVIKSEGNVSIISIMLSTILSMMGGSYWPVEFMPGFMRRAALFSPAYWLVTGLRNIETVTAGTYWLPLLFLLMFSAVVFLLGSWKRIQKAEE